MHPSAPRTDAEVTAGREPPAVPSGRGADRFWLLLGALTAGGLAVRLFDTFVKRRHFDPFSGGDAFYYYWQGRYLADGAGFVDPVQKLFLGPIKQSAYHPPLYGMFLGAVDWLGGTSVDTNRLASVMLGTATIVVIALVARRLAGPRAGLLAAAFAALYPPLWINDAVLLSETMAAFTVAAVLFAAYRFRDRPGFVAAALFGVCVGLASLTRGELILLAPLLLVPMVLAPRNGDLRTRLGLLGVGVAAVVLVVGPWVGYNLARFREPEYITTGSGPVLDVGNCHSAWHGTFIGKAGVGCVAPTLPRSWDESQNDAFLRRRALHYWRTHATRLPIVVAARVGRVWYVFKPAQEVRLDGQAEKRGVVTAQLALGGYLFLMPFAIAGVIVLRRRRVTILPFIVLAVLVTVAVAVAFAVQRYRVPADVGIVIAAAVGADVLWRSLAGRRARSAAQRPSS